MANSMLPKAVFYSELRQGKRSHGGQKLRFKDVLKQHMRRMGILRDTWRRSGSPEGQMAWTVEVKATSAVEEQRQQEYWHAHVRRHSAATSSAFQCNNCQRYCRSQAGLTAYMRACLR